MEEFEVDGKGAIPDRRKNASSGHSLDSTTCRVEKPVTMRLGGGNRKEKGMKLESGQEQRRWGGALSHIGAENVSL